MSWLYWRTGCSLLLVMMMHAAVNNTGAIVEAAVRGALNPLTFHGSFVGWTTVQLAWAVAAVLLYQVRGATLAHLWRSEFYWRQARGRCTAHGRRDLVTRALNTAWHRATPCRRAPHWISAWRGTSHRQGGAILRHRSESLHDAGRHTSSSTGSERL